MCCDSNFHQNQTFSTNRFLGGTGILPILVLWSSCMPAQLVAVGCKWDVTQESLSIQTLLLSNILAFAIKIPLSEINVTQVFLVPYCLCFINEIFVIASYCSGYVTENSSSHSQRTTETQWQMGEPNNALLPLLPTPSEDPSADQRLISTRSRGAQWCNSSRGNQCQQLESDHRPKGPCVSAASNWRHGVSRLQCQNLEWEVVFMPACGHEQTSRLTTQSVGDVAREPGRCLCL